MLKNVWKRLKSGRIVNPLSMTYEEVLDWFQQHCGRGEYHAAALYRSLFRNKDFNLTSLSAFASSLKLAQQVKNELRIHFPSIVRKASQDGVTKLVLRMADGVEVETVIIPMANYATVCISSQAGCRMGCRFCETGQMGLQRDLTADEIVAQVHTVRVRMGEPVRNVVFMGMGEPLDNFDNVTQAIRILSDQRGLDIAMRHITLSTVGLVDGIRRLAALNWPQLKLAVSLNAPDDKLRKSLMPIAEQNPLSELKTVLQSYPLARGNALFMEYVLINSVNDTQAHACRVAAYLEGLPVKLNLIAHNPRRRSSQGAPTQESMARFHQTLIDNKVFVRWRRSKGADIRAACGQLGRSRISC